MADANYNQLPQNRDTTCWNLWTHLWSNWWSSMLLSRHYQLPLFTCFRTIFAYRPMAHYLSQFTLLLRPRPKVRFKVKVKGPGQRSDTLWGAWLARHTKGNCHQVSGKRLDSQHQGKSDGKQGKIFPSGKWGKVRELQYFGQESGKVREFWSGLGPGWRLSTKVV